MWGGNVHMGRERAHGAGMCMWRGNEHVGRRRVACKVPDVNPFVDGLATWQ
jgi:hypothetical protein